MKKLTALLLAILMVFSMAAFVSCSGTDDPAPIPTAEPTENPTAEPTSDPTVIVTLPPAPTDDPEDQEKADKVIDRINKIEEITSTNYSNFKTKIDNARKAYDKLTDTQKALVSEDLVKKLTDAEAAYTAFDSAAKQAAALTVNRLMLASPDVDGEIDAEYLMGTSLVLSKAAVEAFTDEQKAAGAAIVAQDNAILSDKTEVVLYFALDETYLYICEKRTDDTWAYTASSYKQPYTGDGSLIWFTKDGTQLCGLQWNYATKDSDKPQIGLFQQDDQANSELKDYFASTKDCGDYHVLEVAVPLSDLGLTEEDFTAKTVGMTFCSVDVVDTAFDGDSSKLWNSVAYQMQYTGVGSYANAQRFYTQKAPAYSYIANGTPVLDGQPDDLYKDFDGMELSQGTCAAFTDEEKAVGAGMVGDTTIGDSADTHVIFRFAVDNDYLYIVEELQDLSRVFSAQTFRQPYAGDGALIWFTKDGNLKCGLQWNIATQESPDAPQIGLFMNDDQTNSELKEYDYATGTDESGYSLYLEVKVPLSDLGLTYEDFQNAAVGMTFCCVDIVNEEFDGSTSKLWTDMGYQMQYPGVNNWSSAPRLIIK